MIRKISAAFTLLQLFAVCQAMSFQGQVAGAQRISKRAPKHSPALKLAKIATPYGMNANQASMFDAIANMRATVDQKMNSLDGNRYGLSSKTAVLSLSYDIMKIENFFHLFACFWGFGWFFAGFSLAKIKRSGFLCDFANQSLF